MSGTWSTFNTTPHSIEAEIIVMLTLHVDSNPRTCYLEHDVVTRTRDLVSTEVIPSVLTKPNYLPFGTSFNFKLDLEINRPYSKYGKVTSIMKISGVLTHPVTMTNTTTLNNQDSERERNSCVNVVMGFDSQATYQSKMEEDCYPIRVRVKTMLDENMVGREDHIVRPV